jgi:hypothetical protein
VGFPCLSFYDGCGSQVPDNFLVLKLFFSEIVGGCLFGRVLQCYALCYGVMEIGKRGVKLGGVMGVIGFIGGGLGKWRECYGI